MPVVGGMASFTTSSLPLGTATVSAVFDGVGNILGSSSSPIAQVVVPYTTTTMLASSINPSRFRQAVTLIATVTADGKPVTSGTITFVRGSAVLGVAMLGADGTARLTTSALPRRYVRIQASFAGDPDHYGSVSPVFVQAVQKAETTTSLIVGTSRFGRRERTVLVATVDTPGLTGLSPSGVVVFHRGRRVVGRARLVLGTATRVLRRRFRPGGVFFATFKGNARFGRSRSLAIVPDELFRLRVPME